VGTFLSFSLFLGVVLNVVGMIFSFNYVPRIFYSVELLCSLFGLYSVLSGKRKLVRVYSILNIFVLILGLGTFIFFIFSTPWFIFAIVFVLQAITLCLLYPYYKYLSRAEQGKLHGYYSKHNTSLKLWVKHNESPSTQVIRKGCFNVDDFAENVQQKLNTRCQVSLFTSLEMEPLDPGLEIKDLLNMTECKNNSSKTPLFVKVIPATRDSIVKTIYVGDMNDDGDFSGTYKRRIVRNDHDLMKVIQNSAGLIHISSPEDVLINFDDLKNGEKYHIYKYVQNFERRAKKDAHALEVGNVAIDENLPNGEISSILY
jgi:hypothetical protein